MHVDILFEITIYKVHAVIDVEEMQRVTIHVQLYAQFLACKSLKLG